MQTQLLEDGIVNTMEALILTREAHHHQVSLEVEALFHHQEEVLDHHHYQEVVPHHLHLVEETILLPTHHHLLLPTHNHHQEAGHHLLPPLDEATLGSHLHHPVFQNQRKRLTISCFGTQKRISGQFLNSWEAPGWI